MKVTDFLVGVKSELSKVIWPSRKQTIQYTLTVILFSVLVSLILGAFDYLLLRLFETIVNR